MRYVSFIMVIGMLVLQGCVANRSLSSGEARIKALSECPIRDTFTMYEIPSHGAIGDAMMIAALQTTGNDGGFYNDFSSYVKSGTHNIGLYSSNTKKLEAILLHTFSKYPKDGLKNVSVCVIGVTEDESLLQEAKRTKVQLTFAP